MAHEQAVRCPRGIGPLVQNPAGEDAPDRFYLIV